MTEQYSDAATTTPLDDLLRQGAALAEAGELAAAEALFRQALELSPGNPNTLFNLGLTLSNLKRFDDAERTLIEAINAGDRRNSFIVLGEQYEAQKRYSEALNCFQALLQFDSGKYQILLKLGDLQGLIGDNQARVANYRLALAERPGDSLAILRLTDATLTAMDKLWKTNLEAAVRAEEELLALVGGHPRARMVVLRMLMVHKEWSERIRHGEPPYHASNIDELFFNHAQELVEDLNRTTEQVVGAEPKDDSARLTLAVARFCLRDRHGAEAMLRSTPKATSGTMWETVRFAPEFYDELSGLSDEDLVRDLPPLIEVASMPGNPKGILYLACNYWYFVAFALPMLMSLRERSPTTPVHLHIMDAVPQETEFILAFMQKLSPLPFAITIERPGLQQAKVMEARCYYHAIRFIRFYMHLRTYESPLWLMDVDAVVNRDLGELFERLPGHDVAARVRPARIEPWNQFNACVVGANTTASSLDYFRKIAAYLAYFHQRKSLHWGIDQMAMYGVFADMQARGGAPSLLLLGERAVDYDHRDDGYVWPNSGGGKMGHMERVRTPGAPPAAPPTTKFDTAFERYWRDAAQTASAVGVKL